MHLYIRIHTYIHKYIYIYIYIYIHSILPTVIYICVTECDESQSGEQSTELWFVCIFNQKYEVAAEHSVLGSKVLDAAGEWLDVAWDKVCSWLVKTVKYTVYMSSIWYVYRLYQLERAWL